jgi:AcrR family transcriptional regulator
LWTEEGYSIFANEGLAGIQVERLARILQLNKSGFYHYFGDLEGYHAEMANLHVVKVDHFLDDISKIKNFDPDYLNLLVKYATTVMFQIQLTRKKNEYAFCRISDVLDQKVERAVEKLWRDFLGIPDDPALAERFFIIIRDVFSTRVSFENLNYPFLHQLAMEAKQLADELRQHHSFHQPNRTQANL